MGVCVGRGFELSDTESQQEEEDRAIPLMEKPITDVVFVSSPDKCPRGYTMIKECPCGHDANLWVKFLGAKSEERYMCYTKEEKEDGKIIEDMYIPGKGERYIVKGFEVIKKTVEGGDTLNHRFIAYKRVHKKRAKSAMYDAAVFRSKDNPSASFKKLGAKLNNLYICIRIAPYDYKLVDHTQAAPTNTKQSSIDKPPPTQPPPTQQSAPLQKGSSCDDITPPTSYEQPSHQNIPPTQSGAYNAPPTSYPESPPTTQGYNALPTNQGYSAPPTNQGYGSPPTNQEYSAPPTNQGYSAPPTNQGYNPPPTNQGYSAPPTNQGYNPPPTNYGYNAPPTNYGYNAPPTNQGYNPSTASNAPPTNQGVALGFENLDFDQPIPEDWSWEDEDEDDQLDSSYQPTRGPVPVHEMATLHIAPDLSSAPPPGPAPPGGGYAPPPGPVPPGGGYGHPSYPYGSTGYYGNSASTTYPLPPSHYPGARYPPPPSNQYNYMQSTTSQRQPTYPPSQTPYGGYQSQYPPAPRGGGHIGFNI